MDWCAAGLLGTPPGQARRVPRRTGCPLSPPECQITTTAEKPFTHGTFTIERTYDASPGRIFRAFAEQDAKHRWFACHDDWPVRAYSLDFRVGGREHCRGEAGGVEHQMDAYYWDIVPNERIIWACEMHVGGEKISVSLNTIRLQKAGKKTKLIFTEQGAFFWMENDLEMREQGTQELLDALGRELVRA